MLYGVWRGLVWANRVFGPGSYGGWELEVGDDGRRKEGVWIRRRWWIGLFKPEARSEFQVDRGERRSLLGRI